MAQVVPSTNNNPDWMQRPPAIPGCPPGLEYLSQLDCLILNQNVSLVEAFTGWEKNNKYSIKNTQGNQIYFAAEESSGCMRGCCGSQRGFEIFIMDSSNQKVIKISRELKVCAGSSWCAGCCDCCAHEVIIEAPVGTVVGYVKQKGAFGKSPYDILDENQEPVLRIKCPRCIFNGPVFSCDNDFKILTMDGETQVGKLSKVYAGFAKEMFTQADNFSINFPTDLSVKTKAALIGALFLIDFTYFEGE
ncbi:phospholipid scramblase 2-like isoform X1 [Brachionus plicatilis]|uniref:Phospholipid scramblase n=1 Tax=Brachionus plicatilis TaxID=10195 RepID=A0A3M7SNC1_BRAPC|nr:phospholipid scramblase 2-like isoform X1 [Brachionus plicatilis]